MREIERNEEQERAIANIYGPSILISCPGSGKTTTLLRRIHKMIESGINPSKILMLTFTKAAADEMGKKYFNKYGKNSGVTFCTIHALCLRILYNYAGLSGDSIVKESEARFFLMNVARKYREINDTKKTVNSFFTQYSAAKNNGISLHEIKPEELSSKTFLELAGKYEQWKNQSGKIDFDDMLLDAYALLCNDEQVCRTLQGMWDFIQVDEYQDTNMLQKDIIYKLSEKHHNLCVAGDDDQSIYRFRGACPDIMLGFPKDFPDAKIFRISKNYRSLPIIIENAGNLIQGNCNRFTKEFQCSRDGKGSLKVLGVENRKLQGAYVVKEIKSSQCLYSEIAILYRNNSQAELVANSLYENGIPYFSMERIPDSYDSWIWADIVAYYHVAHGSYQKEDVEKVVNHPNRYLGPVLREASDFSENAMLMAANSEEVEWKRRKKYEEIRKLFSDLSKLRKLSLSAFLEYLFLQVGYKVYLMQYAKAMNQDFLEVKQILDIFMEDSKKFESMQEWQQYIYKRKVALQTQEKTGVCLSTMHRSKGLEWEKVIIIDCNENRIPFEKNGKIYDLEEERRLFYVAMTRAKNDLIILYSRMQNRSRFIKEMEPRSVTKQKCENIKSGDFPKNSLVYHSDFGVCMVLENLGKKCRVVSLKDRKQRTVLSDFLSDSVP